MSDIARGPQGAMAIWLVGLAVYLLAVFHRSNGPNDRDGVVAFRRAVIGTIRHGLERTIFLDNRKRQTISV